MKLFQTIKLAWSNICGNKMRSFLTMLGMIIGVASVIILVSLIGGMTDSVLSMYDSFGFNEISVSIFGRNGDPILDENDMYQYVEDNNKDFKGVSPKIEMYSLIKNGSAQDESAHIVATDEYYMGVKERKLASGCGITYSDLLIRRRSCVIGSYVNLCLFGGAAKPGDTLMLDGGTILTIVGILEQSSDNTEWSDDNIVFIPYTTYQRIYPDQGLSYTFYVKDNTQVTNLTKKIESYLYNTFYDKNAYSVNNMADYVDEINKEKTMLMSLGGGIAGISLLVAGIGIMNIMLVSVSERTREIGIRKSLGAKRRDIMRQFVIEAGTTSSLGGIIGIALGWVAAVKLGNLMKIDATPTQGSVIMAFCVSASVGIIFGYLPARKAAKLNPIDALRSE